MTVVCSLLNLHFIYLLLMFQHQTVLWVKVKRGLTDIEEGTDRIFLLSPLDRFCYVLHTCRITTEKCNEFDAVFFFKEY